MAAATKSSQDSLDEFWKASISTANLTKASAVLPPNVYSKLVERQVPRGSTAAEPVLASYEIAKQDCEKKVAQIVKECQMMNQKYSDPYFDLEDRAFCLDVLAPKPSTNDSGADGQAYNVTQNGDPVGNLVIYGPPPTSVLDPPSVKRVGDIFDRPQFFVDGASAKDIRQGREGDCWFLSALSTLCNLEPTEHLINKICVARDQDVGVYGFLIHRDGEWTSVIIDDKLYLREPDYEFADRATRATWEENRIRVNSAEEYRKEFQSNSRSLYYAQSAHPDETWVPLIEKAFGKAHGDYGAIGGGSVGDGVEDLTGGVSTTIIPTDILSKDRFWDESVSKVNEEFLIGCGTTTWDDPMRQGRDGIHGGHAYSVLRAVNYGKERLMLLKNPWGEQEWNGPWSDGSKEWNSDNIKELKHTFGNDGIFWIRYEDVLRKYAVIWRTRLFSKDWKVAQQWTSLAVPWDGTFQDTKFEVTITKTTPTVIVLSKLDERYFQGLTGQYKFQLSFRVHQAGEEDYIMRTLGGETWDRSTSCELTLEPGTYEVILKITAVRNDDAAKIEDVVKDNWLDRRDKLLQVGQAYDLAHAKAQVVEAEEKLKEFAPDTSAKAATTEVAPAETTTTDVAKTEPEGTAQTSDPTDSKGALFYGEDDAPAPAQAGDDKPADKKEEDKPDAPWSAVAVIGLRLYCKDESATIKILRPKPAVVVEAKLDVDDPARDAAKGAEVKDKEKEEVEEKKEEAKKEDEKKGVKIDDVQKEDKKKDEEKDEKKNEKKDELKDDKKDDVQKDERKKDEKDNAT